MLPIHIDFASCYWTGFAVATLWGYNAKFFPQEKAWFLILKSIILGLFWPVTAVCFLFVMGNELVQRSIHWHFRWRWRRSEPAS